jgi:ubiquinone/menaquinone biosynthesis C-methylase UbiE
MQTSTSSSGTMTRIKKAVGEALRQNDSVGGSWRRFRRRQALPNQTFRVGLEKPAARETIANIIHVRGWAVSLNEEEISGRILVDDKPVAELALNEFREDVAEIFNLSEAEGCVGFNLELDWLEICGNAEKASLCVEVTHGSEVMVLGPITLTKSDSPLLLHERGSYKDVWNDASTDHGYAMESVSGFRDYDKFMETGVDSADTMVDMLSIVPSDTVLEIGCGTGRIGASLAKHCNRWIGSDISGQMLSYAIQNLKELPNIDLVELQSSSLREFDDSSIDKVYCTAVFMHLDEWDRYRYVSEAFRVLKPGGICYFDNINLDGDTGWGIFMDMFKTDPASRPANISKTSTTEEISIYLGRAGFTNIKTFPGAHMVAATGVKPKN